MPGDPVVVVFILIVGCAAFLFCILYMFGRMLGFIGQGFMSLFRGRRLAGPSGGIPGKKALICSREQCRKIEYRNGRFCSQCGAPLTKPPTRTDGVNRDDN